MSDPTKTTLLKLFGPFPPVNTMKLNYVHKDTVNVSIVESVMQTMTAVPSVHLALSSLWSHIMAPHQGWFILYPMRDHTKQTLLMLIYSSSSLWPDWSCPFGRCSPVTSNESPPLSGWGVSSCGC